MFTPNNITNRGKKMFEGIDCNTHCNCKHLHTKQWHYHEEPGLLPESWTTLARCMSTFSLSLVRVGLHVELREQVLGRPQ
jgi:hypothetical protein